MLKTKNLLAALCKQINWTRIFTLSIVTVKFNKFMLLIEAMPCLTRQDDVLDFRIIFSTSESTALHRSSFLSRLGHNHSPINSESVASSDI